MQTVTTYEVKHWNYVKRLSSKIGAERFFRRSKIYYAMYRKPKGQRDNRLSVIKSLVRTLEG